jgi:hypothetical protein
MSHDALPPVPLADDIVPEAMAPGRPDLAGDAWGRLPGVESR